MIAELALFSSLSLSAPQVQTEGLFMEAPLTLVGERTSSPTNEVQYSGEGFNQVVPAGNLSPRMAQANMFAASPPLNNGAIEFRAIARGIAVIPGELQNGKAVAVLNGLGWGFMLIAVEDETGSPTTGEIYNQEGEGVGAAIYSFVLPGSYVPGAGEVQKARDGTEMGMDSVHGIDSYAINGLGQTPIHPVTNWYFTVSAATCPNIPVGGANGWCQLNQNKPSTIFVIEHDGMNWGVPRVFLLGSQIAIGGGNLADVEIDALTIDKENRKMLISTSECLPERELLYVEYVGSSNPTSATAYPFYDVNGFDYFVRTHLLLQPTGVPGTNGKEGVKGVCADDPWLANANYVVRPNQSELRDGT